MATATTGFTRESFDRLLETHAGPAWLDDLRRDAWQTFAAEGMPAAHDENWRRTDLRMFRLDRFGPPAPPVAPLPEPLLAGGVDLGGFHSTLDGEPVESVLADSLREQGVLFGTLESIAREHGDRLQRYFERQVVDPARDKFAALASAFWTGGSVLWVPRGVSIDQPFHLFSAMTAGGVDLGRSLVILEEGAEATVLAETASTTASDAGLHSGLIEIFVGPGARLRYVNLQNWGSGVWHFAHQKALVERGGAIQWTVGALGSRLAQVDQQVSLVGPGADAQVNGVIFAEGKQHLVYNTHQHHAAARCHSDLLYKGAVQDRSRLVWRGMIKVDPDAQKTDGYQRNDNLILSDQARADSIPGLEIEADDVKCSHGATAGRVDDELIFYAQARGLSRREATRMIVAGFFQQVFDRITIDSVRDALAGAIHRRVREYQ